MNSEKLYYQDQFMTQFTATVVDCQQDKKGYKLVLDRTAFYPEGGGQPTDKGVLTYMDGEEEITVNITDVHEKADVIYHTADKAVAVGTQVNGTIDWERRFDLMQQHTGDHLISGIIYSMFGYSNVGFHLTEHDLVIDYDGPLTKSDLDAIAARANEIVWANQPVTASYPDNLSELTYRSKVELTGDVRIVQRGDADLCACCGTHVAFTSQAGPVFIISAQNFNGGTRIFAACGNRAIQYMKQRNADCITISHALSSPVEKITTALDNKMKELENMRSEMGAMRRQLIDMWVAATPTDGTLAVAAQTALSSGDLQNFTIALAEKAQIALCYSPDASSKDKICIVAKDTDTNKLGRYISARLGGKGGGKPGIYQGFLEQPATVEQLTALCREFLAQA